MIVNKLCCAMIAAAASVFFADVASASLLIDTRLAGGGKTADVQVGDVVTLEFYAVVTGNNANTSDEGLQTIMGAFRTVGSLKADFTSALIAAPFTSALSSRDTAGGASGNNFAPNVDVDGDGDKDVGSLNSTSSNDYFRAQADQMQASQPEYLFGTATLKILSSNVGESAQIIWNFRPNFTSVPLWREDGSNRTLASGTATFGTPVTLSAVVPEPAAVSLVGAASLMLTRRRRD